VLILILSAIISNDTHAQSSEPQDLTNTSFQSEWERQDLPVAAGLAERSWTWGPRALSVELEDFGDTPEATLQRKVQYFDKGRMELNPNSSTVTMGLLPVEMISGQLQVGFDTFVDWPPARMTAVGDPGDAFPTYEHLQGVFRQERPIEVGRPVIDFLQPGGTILSYDQRASDPGTAVGIINNGYGVPQAFLDFQNQTGLIYVNGIYQQGAVFSPAESIFGLPVTAPYWVTAQVAGEPVTILMQVFERRILTYNPANEPRFQVEMGNVGRHYYQWRYGVPPAPGEQDQPLPQGETIPGLPTEEPDVEPTVVSPTVPPVTSLPTATTPVPTEPTETATTPVPTEPTETATTPVPTEPTETTTTPVPTEPTETTTTPVPTEPTEEPEEVETPDTGEPEEPEPADPTPVPGEDP
jgi:hypothetical protein